MTARRITARRTMGCGVPVNIIGQASLLQVPVDLVLALGGERRVDAVLVDLEGTAGDLLALGQRPGTQRVADVVESGHEAGEVGNRHATGLGLHVLDRRTIRTLDNQRFAVGNHGGLGFIATRPPLATLPTLAAVFPILL